MSVVLVEIGLVSWVRAWVCDHCGRRCERQPNGERHVAYGLNAEGKRQKFEFDAEVFPGESSTAEGRAFVGWVRLERITAGPVKGLPAEPAFHLCPTCAPALLDALLSKCPVPTATTQPALNVVELPR